MANKFIYKLPSKRLKDAGWNLELPLSCAMKNQNDLVALSDSQLLRWICELNHSEHLDQEVSRVKKEIGRIRKMPPSRQGREKLSALYETLYSLQYQRDYFCMIMNSNSDYDRANKGFRVNGYPYHRLLGTNGGIKKSTIVYLGDSVFQEIAKRMDNGRDRTKPIIPAKLEAYQALICSASIPVAIPRILIVKNCTVEFTENVITISDEGEDEPQLAHRENYPVRYCDSDGYGLMSPAYSRIIHRELCGEKYAGQTISGVNTRYAWTKGMLFTFDFVEFARRKNQENYQIQDAWGQWRDVREYDVILTSSMVKLWDSYRSLEHFAACCVQNHYQFSVSKVMPHTLENVRNANYQFLQSYDLTDSELEELCRPTMEEIRDVLGGDWRRAVVFAKGMYLNEENAALQENDFVKALMIDPRTIKDPFMIEKLHSMIRKRILMAAKGSIQLSGNFALVSGDLYSLAQSLFGLPVTGLLRKGEVYHRYWIDKGVEDIALFRAPMTCHNNIRRRKVVHSPEMDFWYQYNTTGIILNSWDTTCDAANGSDKDGDMFFTTDNRIIVEHTLNSTTIECMQRKAEKIIPGPEDLVQANKLAFGDEIGTTTNRITAMIERQAAFAKDSEEYRVLDYRIKCGQHYQQCAIDKANGILSRPMPRYWYNRAQCARLPEDTPEEKHFKELCLRIVAERKPYFMRYIYPELMTEYNRYLKNSNSKCIREFQISLADLIRKPDRTPLQQDFLDCFERSLPVGDSPCTVNRICHLFEDTFGSGPSCPPGDSGFDHSILKSGAAYSKNDYQKIAGIKAEYDEAVKRYRQAAGKQRQDKEEASLNRSLMLAGFRQECVKACPNEKELCDIVVDLCYSSPRSRQFAWDICGDIIIENLLDKNDRLIHYPVRTESQGEFSFGGEQFILCARRLDPEEDFTQ